MDNAHIVLCNLTNEAHCQHCGGRYKFKFPMPLPDMTELINAFMLLHADCKAPEQPLVTSSQPE